MTQQGTRATPENRGADAAAQYRGERQSRATDGQGGRRARHVLELEDMLLVAWVFLSESVVRRWIGEPLQLAQAMTTHTSSDGWSAWFDSLPWFGWVIVGLFLFILLTRGPEDTDRDVALERRWPMLMFSLPFLSIYALIATGIQRMVFGLPERPPGALPPWPGPYVPGVVRRTAAIPLALLGDGLFRQQIGFAGIAVDGAGWRPEWSPTLLLMVVASALPFAIFVAGPRIAAGDVLAWRPWIIRFLFFYATVFISHIAW